MTDLKIHMPGSKWRPLKKYYFIILKCLEKGRKFWKSQGKIREKKYEP